MYKQPNIEPITNRIYQLVDDFSYEWVTSKNQMIINKITIPSGFRYDGASIPRFLWTITGFLPDGLHRAASLIHDYIYYYKGNIPKESFNWRYRGDSDETSEEVIGKWSRKDCDKLFYKILKEYGVRNSRLLYYSVRLLGWLYWNF